MGFLLLGSHGYFLFGTPIHSVQFSYKVNDSDTFKMAYVLYSALMSNDGIWAHNCKEVPEQFNVNVNKS